MANQWSMSKEDLYGPPPAYSLTNPQENPPSYRAPPIYVLPLEHEEYAHHQPPIISPPKITFSKNFSRFILGSGLAHMTMGLTTIVCDIILTIMNESYSFVGLWTGALNIILGIYLILFISQTSKHINSIKQCRSFQIILSFITIIGLILSSMNLASDSCYKIFLAEERCQHSAYSIKIVLVTCFALNFIHLCSTTLLTFIHTRRNIQTTEFIG